MSACYLAQARCLDAATIPRLPRPLKLSGAREICRPISAWWSATGALSRGSNDADLPSRSAIGRYFKAGDVKVNNLGETVNAGTE